MTSIGFLVTPQQARADVGAISITSLDHISGNQYKIYGTWEPQGRQCWTPGGDGTFHYRIRIEVDGTPVNPNPTVNPAACNEDYLSPVSNDDRGLGGHWPAVAHANNGGVPQPDAVFSMPENAQEVCAVLLHVQPNGQDAVATQVCLPAPQPTPGSLQLTKVIESGNALPDTFSFTINPDPNGVGAVNTSNGMKVFDNLPAGTYSITETAINGYHQVSTTCTNVAVVSGQQASCEIRNAQDISQDTVPVTFEKIVTGGGNPNDWTFTYNGHTYANGETVQLLIGEGGQVTEQGPDGYSFVGASGICSEDGNVYLFVPEQGGTCTFTNARDRGTLTIIKHVVNDNGGTKTSGDFTLNVTGQNVSAVSFAGSEVGTDVTLDTGTYSVDETAASGYTKTLSADCAGTIAKNEQKTCTITNDDNAPIVVPPRHITITAPILTIDKTVNATTAQPNGQLAYTIVVKNTGTATAENVVITDTLPAGLTFADVTGSTRTWNLGSSLTPGQTTTLTYPVNVTGTAVAGSYTNTALATASNHANIQDTATVTVTIPSVLGATAPKLTLTKTTATEKANHGDTVTFTIIVKNEGDADATNVVLTDVLPDGLRFTDTKALSREWTIGTLHPDQSVTMTYRTTVESTALEGTHTNIAELAFAEGDPIEALASVDVRAVKVLGATTLEDTGAGLTDGLLWGTGALLLLAGFFGFRRREPVG
jgi:uncharacterized repeat protein (TIGR01451 family)